MDIGFLNPTSGSEVQLGSEDFWSNGHFSRKPSLISAGPFKDPMETAHVVSVIDAV